METGLDVLWVTHAIFRTLSADEQSFIYQYFESLERSGGGEVADFQWVSDKRGDPSALLIKFIDPLCVERVCARDHKLALIFPANEVFSMDQKLETRAHSAVHSEPAVTCSGSSKDDFVILSECGMSSPMCSSPDTLSSDTTKVEVYEFPEDCIAMELTTHFQEASYATHCFTEEELAWNDTTHSFILEYSSSEAKQILAHPLQLLEEGDVSTGIRVRQYITPTNRLLVKVKKSLNVRMIKNCFKKLAPVDNCTKHEDDMQFIVTFTNVQDAERLASQQTIALNPSLQVEVELYHGANVISSGPSSTSAFSQRSDSPMSSSSLDITLNPKHLAEHGAASDIDRDYSSPLPVKGTPPPVAFKAEYTETFMESEAADLTVPSHIEIEKLSEFNTADMYSLLNLHFYDVLDDDFACTKYEHSYDECKNVFRFDLKPQDIEKLLSSKQLLIDGDDNSILSMRALASGYVVVFKVVNNPAKVGLGKSNLAHCFGEKSRFSSSLTFLKVERERADMRMECCSVASLVVSIGKHVLDNKIELQASFPSDALSAQVADNSAVVSAPKVVLMETAMSRAVLAKFVKTKLKGVLTQQLEDHKYLVEFDDSEAANQVVEQKAVDMVGSKVQVSFYTPTEDATSEDDSAQPTHIEVKKHAKTSAKDMHQLLLLHMGDVLGHDILTSFQHSYDPSKDLFRFDLSPPDIEQMTNTPQYLDEKKKKSKIVIDEGHSGPTVFIRPAKGCDKQLSKTQIKAAFGPKSQFSSKVEVVSYASDLIELKLETCSVAALVVSIREHKLKNGMLVEASFSKEVGSSSDESVSTESASSEEEGLDNAVVRGLPAEERTGRRSPNSHTANRRAKKSVPADCLPPKTLLLENLLDVDEQTIYFWIKSLIAVWPLSVQISATGENAIVKVPGSCPYNSEVNEKCKLREFQLQGERVIVSNVQPACAIQVICSNSQPGVIIEADTIEAYFSNERYTGVKNSLSLQSVEEKTTYNDLPVYVVTYSASQDVDSVLNHKPHKLSKWRLDVAEYYPLIGVCGQDSLCIYKNNNKQDGADSQTPGCPIVHINNVDKKPDLDTLKLYMGSRKRTNGGKIESWSEKAGTTPESISVQVVYEEPDVAERVFDFYQRHGLKFNNQHLELELETPWLTKVHDDHKVRVSGLTNDLDPEKLKFYLSAISDNVVVDIFFDERQTRAVAQFQQVIEYGKLLSQARRVPLADCPQLRIQQEYKSRDLIATGSFTKDDLELPLESLLYQKFGPDVEVIADEFPGTVDIWRISTEPEALPYILEQKHSLPHCKSIAPYSEFLGLHVTSGAQQKTQTLSNLLSDQLMLQFLLEVPSGHQTLADHLRSLGMLLSKDGTITAKSSSNKQDNRIILKNWRMLKSKVDKFIAKGFFTFTTEPLTKPIFEKVEAILPKLVSGQPVITEVSSGRQLRASVGNRVAITGERRLVEGMKDSLLQMISNIEREIQEEKSVITVDIPNVTDYQIKYLELINFFHDSIRQLKLKDFTADVGLGVVSVQGRPDSINAVQKTMFEMFPKLSQSKVFSNKKPLFFRVFNTSEAKKAIQDGITSRQLQAVYIVENKSISVYSRDKSTSRAAMDCIEELIWEAQYPVDHDLDDLERQLLVSALWKQKKAELVDQYKPLEIVELGDRGGVSMVGLGPSKNNIMEEIPRFFDMNVKRTAAFTGIADRISFLKTFQERIFRELELAHNVSIALKGQSIEICGTKDDIADCQRALTKKHNGVCKDVFAVGDPSMAKYINKNREFLETAGLKSRCLVVPHKEDATVLPVVPARRQAGSSSPRSRYSVTLPSGSVCEVCNADITSMNCDAIINAANGDLAHVGGLALAIVNKGGTSIQEECTEFVGRNGQLMEGQVFTSSAGSLKCKKIIHAVGPRWRGGSYQEDHTLFSCIDNCFEQARIHNFTSIAIPPISTGIFGFPLSQAVKVIVDVVKARQTDNDYLPKQILFVDNKDDSLILFQSHLSAHFETTPVKPEPFTRASPQRLTSQPTTVSTDKLSITGNNIRIMKRVNLEIRSGDLSKSEEHTLVNSVDGGLQLTNGRVAQAIAAKAGPQLQAQCNTLAPVAVGDVKETDGYQLTCKKVLHCNCPPYQAAQSIQVLQQIVSKCLTMAASNNHTSIAFPALGTGNLHYPEKEVARGMIEAIIDYAVANPNSSVLDVKIVVYHQDKKIQEGFDEELQRLMASGNVSAQSSAPAPKRLLTRKTCEKRQFVPLAQAKLSSSVDRGTLKGSVTLNNTAVRVIEGDISEHRADVLVNSTDSSLNNQGQVSKALLKQAGPSVRGQLRSLTSKNFQHGICVTKAGDLQADYIFHVDAQSCSRSNNAWRALLTACLRKCDELEVRSIAFPALGTGILSVSPKEMASTILQAVTSYLNKHPQSTLQSIDVVIFLPQMVDDFVQSMKTSIERKESWWTRVAVKVSGWITGAFMADPQTTQYGTTRSRRNFASEYPTNPSLPSAENVELKLDIYGGTEADIQDCKSNIQSRLVKVVETVMWKDKATYLEDREFISKLSSSQVHQLQEEAKRLDVKLHVDQRLVDIKIAGLSKDTYAMSDIIARELKGLERMAHEEKEEGLIALAIQWMYEEEPGEWAKFEASINKALEDIHKKNPNAVYKYDTEDGEVKLDLRSMEGVDLSLQPFKIQRIDLSKRSGLDMPSHWSAPLDTYRDVTLIPATPEYAKVENDFLSTLGAGGNTVLQIQRIQNPTLYQHYAILRKDVAKRLKQKEDQVERTPLWHGTSEDTVSKITTGKFDRGLSGKNATALGCGSYFAKKSSYSAQNTYSKPNAQGHKYMIQTRVITGDWCQGSNQMKAAPYKPNQIDQYDSVVDNPADPSIFVVFHDASAYPEYIIKFQ